MYVRTKDGALIEGEIINRYSKTMSVRDANGETHVCQLVGEPKAVPGEKFTDPVRVVKPRVGRRPKPVGIKYRNGEIEHFPTMNSLGIAMGCQNNLIIEAIEEREGMITQGKFKGCEVFYILED